VKRSEALRHFGAGAALAPFGFSADMRVASAQSAQDPVTVGIIGSSSDAPFFIAEQFGYFRDVGIAASFVKFDGAPLMVAPLGVGQLDVGSGSPSAGLLNAVERGIDVRIVADKGRCAPGYGYGPLMVRKALVTSGAYKSARDLRGLKVAEAAQGGTSSSSLAKLLGTVGLGYGDVQHVYLGYAEQAVAFANGSIDASLSNEPSATLAERQGSAMRVAGNDTWYPNQEVAVVIYGKTFLRERRDVATRFMTAWIRAARYFNDALGGGHLRGRTASSVLDILVAATPIKDRTVYTQMVPQAVDPDGEVNAASVRGDLAFWKQQRWVTGNVTAEQAIDMTFSQAAAKALGPYKPRR
jgi:NitT/TauT family transport system substrate-binding protein